MRFIKLLMAACIMLSASQILAQGQKIEKAKELFEKLVILSDSFDSAVADLYSSEAVIRNTRHYAFGQTRVMTMPAQDYKNMIRSTMPIAKLRGDISTFSDVRYYEEGDKIRIRATRYSKLKNYSFPYSLLVGEDENGNWLIYEENLETKP